MHELAVRMLQVDLGTMHVRCSVRGIRCNASAWPAASGMLVQPSTGHLVLASSSGALQFYDPVRCCLCPMQFHTRCGWWEFMEPPQPQPECPYPMQRCPS